MSLSSVDLGPSFGVPLSHALGQPTSLAAAASPITARERTKALYEQARSKSPHKRRTSRTSAHRRPATAATTVARSRPRSGHSQVFLHFPSLFLAPTPFPALPYISHTNIIASLVMLHFFPPTTLSLSHSSQRLYWDLPIPTCKVSALTFNKQGIQKKTVPVSRLF